MVGRSWLLKTLNESYRTWGVAGTGGTCESWMSPTVVEALYCKRYIYLQLYVISERRVLNGGQNSDSYLRQGEPQLRTGAEGDL
jgi:hypothetical protein